MTRTTGGLFDLTDFSALSPEVDLNDGVIPFALVQSRGAQQIVDQLAKYKVRSSGLNLATINQLAPSAQVEFFGVHTKGKSSALYRFNGQQLPVLTIKMVYGHPRNFDNNGARVTVRKPVFSAYQDAGELRVRFETHN